MLYRATITSNLPQGIYLLKDANSLLIDASTMHSDVGNWDRSVIQDILKEIAQTQQIDLNAKKRFKGEIHIDANAAEADAMQHVNQSWSSMKQTVCQETRSRHYVERWRVSHKYC